MIKESEKTRRMMANVKTKSRINPWFRHPRPNRPSHPVLHFPVNDYQDWSYPDRNPRQHLNLLWHLDLHFQLNDSLEGVEDPEFSPVFPHLK